MAFSAPRLTIYALLSATEEDLRDFVLTYLEAELDNRTLFGEDLQQRAERRYVDENGTSERGLSAAELVPYVDLGDLIELIKDKDGRRKLTVETDLVTVRATRGWVRAEGDQIHMAERPQGDFSRQLFLGEERKASPINAATRSSRRSEVSRSPLVETHGCPLHAPSAPRRSMAGGNLTDGVRFKMVRICKASGCLPARSAQTSRSTAWTGWTSPRPACLPLEGGARGTLRTGV